MDRYRKLQSISTNTDNAISNFIDKLPLKLQEMNNKKEKPSEDVSEANKSVMDDVWELL